MNILKFHVRKALGLPVHYYYKPAAIPAATHLQVLIGLGRTLSIKSVLEFGAGRFSTLAFLNRELFPNITRVHSYETDPDWKRRVEAEAQGDSRLTIELIGEDVDRVAAACDYSKFDLVFVDNGPARAETIREVVSHSREWNLVVIHDFENRPYQIAAKGLRQLFCFDAYCPHTAVLWNEQRTGRDVRPVLSRMNRIFKRHAASTGPDDIERWRTIVSDAI